MKSVGFRSIAWDSVCQRKEFARSLSEDCKDPFCKLPHLENKATPCLSRACNLQQLHELSVRINWILLLHSVQERERISDSFYRQKLRRALSRNSFLNDNHSLSFADSPKLQSHKADFTDGGLCAEISNSPLSVKTECHKIHTNNWGTKRGQDSSRRTKRGRCSPDQITRCMAIVIFAKALGACIYEVLDKLPTAIPSSIMERCIALSILQHTHIASWPSPGANIASKLSYECKGGFMPSKSFLSIQGKNYSVTVKFCSFMSKNNTAPLRKVISSLKGGKPCLQSECKIQSLQEGWPCYVKKA